MKSILAVCAALSVVTLAAPAQAAPGHDVKNCDTTLHGTVHNVTVGAGSSCIIPAGVTVTGGVHAKAGAVELIVSTSVAHNIQAKGVTGLVQIGPPTCKFDPQVGNNVHVFQSHDVLICQVTTKNNIHLAANDGQISVLDSHAGNNIMVHNTRPFVPDNPPSTHADPGAIRILRSTAGNHIRLHHNDGRDVIVKDDSPTPLVR